MYKKLILSVSLIIPFNLISMQIFKRQVAPKFRSVLVRSFNTQQNVEVKVKDLELIARFQSYKANKESGYSLSSLANVLSALKRSNNNDQELFKYAENQFLNRFHQEGLWKDKIGDKYFGDLSKQYRRYLLTKYFLRYYFEDLKAAGCLREDAIKEELHIKEKCSNEACFEKYLSPFAINNPDILIQALNDYWKMQIKQLEDLQKVLKIH